MTRAIFVVFAAGALMAADSVRVLQSNAAGDNKTIEVIGDNFRLQYSTTAVPNGGGSVYIDDFSTNGDVVKSYHVLDNVFPDGTSVDIATAPATPVPSPGVRSSATPSISATTASTRSASTAPVAWRGS